MSHKDIENGESLTVAYEMTGILSGSKINVCSCQTVKEDLLSDCIITVMVATRVNFSQRDALS